MQPCCERRESSGEAGMHKTQNNDFGVTKELNADFEKSGLVDHTPD
jgi:hypothetical protein